MAGSRAHPLDGCHGRDTTHREGIMLLQLALAGALALSMFFAGYETSSFQGDQLSGQTGYEGQPGNQSNGGNGDGLSGYEGQPGNQGGGNHNGGGNNNNNNNGNGLKGYEGQPGNQGGN